MIKFTYCARINVFRNSIPKVDVAAYSEKNINKILYKNRILLLTVPEFANMIYQFQYIYDRLILYGCCKYFKYFKYKDIRFNIVKHSY